MGYTKLDREYAGQSVNDFFTWQFRGKDRRVIDGYTVAIHGEDHQGVWYGLYEIDEDPRRVVALVCPIDNFSGSGAEAIIRENFGYKDMDESEGPFYYGMPKHLFRQLTPPTKSNSYAIEWRRKVAQRLHIKAANQLVSDEQLALF